MEVICLITILGLNALWSAGHCAGLTAGDPCPSPHKTSPDGTHCPVYYFCGNSPHQIWMKRFCVYPQVFSVSSHTCEEYEAVDCRSRGVPFTPCEYIPQCQHHEAGTCFCKGHISYGDVDWAFCIGKTTGYYPYNTRLSTPYYIQCKDNRTVPSTCGEGLIFDQFDMICRVERSLTPSMVMNATATVLHSSMAKSGSRYMTSYPATASIINSTSTNHTGQFTRNVVSENYESISTVFKGSQYTLTTNQIGHSILQTTKTANIENEKLTKSPTKTHDDITLVTSLGYQSDILSGNPFGTSLNGISYATPIESHNTRPTIYKISQITTPMSTFNRYSTIILTSRPTQSSKVTNTTLNSVHIPSIMLRTEVYSLEKNTFEVTDIMLASSLNALTSVDIDWTQTPTKLSSFPWSSFKESYVALVSTLMGKPVDAESSILVAEIQTETPRMTSSSMHQTDLFTSAVAETAVVANSGKPTVLLSDLVSSSGSEMRTAVLSESVIPMISGSDITTLMTSNSEMPFAIVSESLIPTSLVSDSETAPSIVHDSIMPTPSVYDSETTPALVHDSIMPLPSVSDSETTPAVVHDSIMPTPSVSDSAIKSSMASDSEMATAVVSHSITKTAIMATSELPSTVLLGLERPSSLMSDSKITSMMSGSETSTAVMLSSGVPTSVHSGSIMPISIVPDSIIPKSKVFYSTMAGEIMPRPVIHTAKVSYSEGPNAVATNKISSEAAMSIGSGSYTDISTSTVSIYEFQAVTAIASKSLEMFSSTVSDSVIPIGISTDSGMPSALTYAPSNDISPSMNLQVPVTARSAGAETFETVMPISLIEETFLHPSLSNYHKRSTAIDETSKLSPYRSEIITKHTTKMTGNELHHSVDTEVGTSMTSSQSSTSIGGVQSSRTSRHLDTKSAGSDVSSAMSSSLTNLRSPGESLMTLQQTHPTPTAARSNVRLTHSSEMIQLVTSGIQESLLSLKNHFANTNIEQLITTLTVQPVTSGNGNSELSVGNPITISEMDPLKTSEIMQGLSFDHSSSSSHYTNSNIRPSKTSESYQLSENVDTTSGPTSAIPSALHPTTQTDPQHTSDHPNNVSVVVAGAAGGVILAAALTILTLIIKGLKGKKESLTITNPDDVQADININPLLNQKEADLMY